MGQWWFWLAIAVVTAAIVTLLLSLGFSLWEKRKYRIATSPAAPDSIFDHPAGGPGTSAFD